jgi:hypothetical protein
LQYKDNNSALTWHKIWYTYSARIGENARETLAFSPILSLIRISILCQVSALLLAYNGFYPPFFFSNKDNIWLFNIVQLIIIHAVKLQKKKIYNKCLVVFFFCPMKVIDLIFDFQKMAGQNYPWYLQTLDLLNFMIIILVYNGCKVYKYKYWSKYHMTSVVIS